MKKVTIRRCPVCANIKTHTEALTAALHTDPDLSVHVVDGAKGEFTVDVDGRKISGTMGENLRSAEEIAAEVRGETVAAM